jgi:hypothetical protein
MGMKPIDLSWAGIDEDACRLVLLLPGCQYVVHQDVIILGFNALE